MLRILLLLSLLLGQAIAADCPQPSGRILIKTQPEKAAIWLDEQKLADAAPMVTPPLCAGQHRLRVEAQGYETQTLTVEVTGDILLTQTVTLNAVKPLRDPKTGMELVLIPKGCFQMGSPESEEGRFNEEQQHRVCIEGDYYLGKYEVTQGQWEAVMGNNPSRFKGANRPVDQVSWDDIQEFLRKLNAQTGQNYRLPTEAEWEYAARAGTSGAYSFGDDANQLGQYAWYKDNNGWTYPVGTKLPNPWGLYDMHGNVWEWTCSGWARVYNGEEQHCGSSATYRVVRGGSCSSDARLARSALRINDTPDNQISDRGFRVMLPVPRTP